ncbi:MAG: ferredoxin [Bacilli bacterium]|nr:ferredoxin [Bacilli bacterium]MDD4809299.1 ferredoxin [Bacilli bacterium]
MKSVKIVKEDCIGCGACEAITDEVFKLNDEGISEVVVDEVPEELEDDVKEAADSCPTDAIVIEENE